MSLNKGTLLCGGKYRLEEVLGQGGFGITYRAIQVALSRDVCIKEFFLAIDNQREADGKTVTVLPSTPSRDRGQLFNEYKKKFFHEAQRQSSIDDNPHLVRVYDLWEENGTAYYAMEFVRGTSLDQLYPLGHPMPEETVMSYAYHMIDVLEFIHSKNIYHLDIKPANIMISEGGVLKLIDFGASKCLSITTSSGTTSLMPLTEGYAPQEQAEGAITRIGPWSDIYALGATLYRLATGQRPPKASDILYDGADAFSWKSTNVTLKFQELVMAMMRYRCQERPQSASAVRKLIDKTSVVQQNGDQDERTIIVQQRPPMESQQPKSVRPEERYFDVLNVPFTMIKVEAGRFMMGATPEQVSEALTMEKPAHEVWVDSFYICKLLVTQRLWQVVMNENPSKSQIGDAFPVDSVSWNECQKFISKLNELTGEHFRLPTEAEWEFAARGGHLGRGYKYAGSNNLGDVAWFWNNSGGQTHPVAKKAPNELGIYDMCGNVWEWCSDFYGPYSPNFQRNPTGNSSSRGDHVYRGGGWYSYAKSCRLSSRLNADSTFISQTIGLRLAL